ncbi:MAG: N-acetylneuraminate synthase family protein [Candidatus Omnitrophota bacterium]
MENKKNKENIYELCQRKIVITAEIGINHNGDLSLAKEMIDAAAECGVDAVKFQAFNTPFMYSHLTPGFKHTDHDVFAQMKSLEVSDHWWPHLKAHAENHRLFFSCSIFDLPSLHVVKEFGIDFLKVASSEINNHAFLEAQKELSPIVVVSTGMAFLDEISQTIRFLNRIGIHQIILLECTSSYPSPPEAIHLLNIDFLRETFHLPSGFSDHALGIHHAIAAAARNARFIEKHFTLDKTLTGPDQSISADPAEMKTLVHAVRDIEASLKTNSKMSFSPCEENSREIGRKSLIASRNIREGERITPENTVVKRPGKGIPPEQARFVYGREAQTDISEDQWITWEMIR